MEITNVSLVYILTRLGKRVLGFFRHWYVDGFIRSIHWTYNLLERLDRRFAVRITAKNWFQPLYQDYSFIGYLWGFIFRTVRILVGLSVYLIFLCLAIMFFVLWAALPLLVIYKVIINSY